MFVWSRTTDAALSLTDRHAMEIHVRIERWTLDEIVMPSTLDEISESGAVQIADKVGVCWARSDGAIVVSIHCERNTGHELASSSKHLKHLFGVAKRSQDGFRHLVLSITKTLALGRASLIGFPPLLRLPTEEEVKLAVSITRLTF